jgi:hypothetical protein
VTAPAKAKAKVRGEQCTPVRPRAPYAFRATRSRAGLIARLATQLPRVGLHGVLRDLDRAAEQCPVPGDAAGPGLTWDEADRDDPSWWPQGVATTRSGDVLLVSWYAKRRGLRTPGARISVIDRTARGGPRYRHVLLVRPRRLLGVLTLGTVPVHAGGIALDGNLLYVADTVFGVRLFRLEDVLRAPRETHRGAVRRFRSHGHDYVLPQFTALRTPLRAGRRRLRHSFLSIGEVPGGRALVVGEYRRKGEGPPRLARYPLDAGTGLPAADVHGFMVPLEVYETQPPRMQGAAVHGSTWFLTASAGEDVPGDLYVGAPGSWTRHRGVLPTGPEDLSWSRPGEELWCVTEWPGRRWVFPVATGRWGPSGGMGTART